MLDNPNDQGYLVRMDDGSEVERDVLNVVEKIRAYDPNLRIQYLAHAAQLGDAPYRIVEHCRDGRDRVVFYVWKLDNSVMERLYSADTVRTDVLAALDRNNSAARRRNASRYDDERGEAQDITASMLRSRKGRWTFEKGGRLIQVDDTPGYKHEIKRVSE